MLQAFAASPVIPSPESVHVISDDRMALAFAGKDAGSILYAVLRRLD